MANAIHGKVATSLVSGAPNSSLANMKFHALHHWSIGKGDVSQMMIFNYKVEVGGSVKLILT